MRLLATWELGVGYGHIANLSPVCEALRMRGHKVSLAARTPAIARALAPTAFDRIVQSPVYGRPAADGDTLTYGQLIAAAGFVDMGIMGALVRGWLALFDAMAPDALLVEHAPASLLAAHVAGLPAVRIGQSFVAPQPRDAGATLFPWAPHSADQLARAQCRSDTVVREICAAFRAPPLDGLAALLSGAPAHTLSWAELDHFGPGAAGIYYGPLEGVRADARPEWPACGGPRVLVYLPFDGERGRGVAEALRGLGWPALWHAGNGPDFALPSNIRFSESPIDLWTLGPQAALFIGRGGAGTSAVMLRAGVPQLLFPDTLESLLLTWRLRNAGVAQSQRSAVGARPIAAALCDMLSNERITRCARRAAAPYADYEPSAAAGRLADDLLRIVGR